jgi:hypothetical protein
LAIGQNTPIVAFDGGVDDGHGHLLEDRVLRVLVSEDVVEDEVSLLEIPFDLRMIKDILTRLVLSSVS